MFGMNGRRCIINMNNYFNDKYNKNCIKNIIIIICRKKVLIVVQEGVYLVN